MEVPRVGGVLSDVIESVWAEPRIDPLVGTSRLDLVLVAGLVVAACVEGALRTDVPWPAYTVAWTLVAVVAVLGRRQWPLAMTVLAFSAQSIAGLGPVLAGREYGILFVTACVLLFPYSLARWGAGRDIALGLTFVLACHFIREPLYAENIANIMLGAGFLLFPAALGVAVRFYQREQQRKRDQIRAFERETLARELHDTLAHHVSGILLQAQAGRVMAATDPARALSVLAHVEEAATTSMAEMRSLVGLLRDGEPGARSPRQGMRDLSELVRGYAGGGQALLHVSGELAEVNPAVDAAIYRVVQESLTNTRLHAREATRIDIEVIGEREHVRIKVSDDGRPHARQSRRGYGLIGMSERMQLLGGSMQAGPQPARGWTVLATVPRDGGNGQRPQLRPEDDRERD